MTMGTRAPAVVPALGRTLAWLATVGLAAACGAYDGGPPPPPPQGNAIMAWTIDEATDPNLCNQSGAATFHVVLYDSTGAFAGEYVQDCSAFATTLFGLYPDTYTGQANLLDANGSPRTTSVDLAPFDVVDGVTVTVSMDFPSNSFF